MSSAPTILLPPKLVPVFDGGADYRGAFGGRGSGKSHSFAKMSAVRGVQWAEAGVSGVIVCGREFQNTLSESSLAEVKYAIESEPFLRDAYEVGDSFIRTRDRRVEYAFAGLRHNLDSIKSKARILLLWVDEAEPVSDLAWDKALPTVREEGSETWVTWNPERKTSATNRRFRESPPGRSRIVELNWRDNPWFTDKLNRERLEDKEKRPERYAHIWDGEFVTAIAGAYFAKQLNAAREEGRITHVAADPILTLRVHCDIGGTGQRADAFVMWVDQFVGPQIRVLNHYETSGQEAADHIAWLRGNKYTPDRATIVLPHDGKQNDRTQRVSYESVFKDAGYEVVTIPNMGAGAAMTGIETVRRVFPNVWFNGATTEAGREALGAYHEKMDPTRDVGLGPLHDWSSHSARAFDVMAVDYETNRETKWAKAHQPKIAIV